MTATPREALGAPTVNRKWCLDVDTSTSGTPDWTGVFGVQEFKDSLDATRQDDSDFESGGWKSEATTANKWGIEIKVKRAVTAALATEYDPGQEHLRLAAQETGVGNIVKVRWYEMEPGGPRVESYEGFATVAWSPDGGGQDALSTVTVTLSGRGKRTPVAHPETVTG